MPYCDTARPHAVLRGHHGLPSRVCTHSQRLRLPGAATASRPEFTPDQVAVCAPPAGGYAGSAPPQRCPAAASNALWDHTPAASQDCVELAEDAPERADATCTTSTTTTP